PLLSDRSRAVPRRGRTGPAIPVGSRAWRWKVLTQGKRLAVFSIREGKGGTVWVRAGSAFVNRDGSLNVLLGVLPLDGKLHVGEAGDRRESAETASEPKLAAVGGAQ